MGKDAGSVGSMVVVLEGMVISPEEGEDVKNEVGRAMRTTPRREKREAYCAERGKGSCRNT